MRAERTGTATTAPVADTSIWTSQNAAVATVAYVANSAFEGVINRPPGAGNGSTFVIVSQGNAQIRYRAGSSLSLIRSSRCGS